MPRKDSTPLLAIVGATASAKSDVALALAVEFHGEIVSCDSVQVYRGFEVGCAKPSAAVQARVRHHLIDVAEPHEPFDAGRFCALAAPALADIRARARVPILCGGTGLYLRALRHGLVDVPAPPAELRAALYAEEAAAPGTLFARLAAVDPATAAHTSPRNLVHVVRALEILATTGEPASLVRARHGFREETVPMRVLVLAWPLALLRERIRARTADMLARGLVAEVERLLGQGVDPAARPMRAVGYKEACAVVRGEAPLDGLEAGIVKSTIDYARRQGTWFRRESNVTWCEVTSVDAALAAAEREARALNLHATRAMP